MRPRLRPRAAARIAGLAFLAVDLGSPPAADPAPLGVSLQAASFPAAGGGSTTRFYLEVNLTPVAAESVDLRVKLDVFDDGGRRAGGGDWIHPGVASAGPFRRIYAVAVPPGRASARVRVEDLRTETAGEASLAFEAPRFDPAGLALSDVVIAAREEGEPTFPFRGEFGPGRETLVALLEVRDRLEPEPAGPYRVRAVLSGRRGVRRVRELEVARRDGGGQILLEERVADLEPGEYRLEIEVSLGDADVERETGFRVGESGLSLGADPDRLRTVLGYVATLRERILLEETASDSLASLWEAFWARRDPTPGTARNESEEEFLSRVEEAGRRFGGLDPGWRSDMGRIFIRFGPPDRVERFDAQPDRSGTEVWTYEDRRETFVFLDEGFGRYRLAGER
jgi:GWxTD domain-containing protein